MEERGEKMTANNFFGIFLIAGILLAGSAWAGESSNQAFGNQTAARTDGSKEATIPPEVALPGPKAVAVSEKEAVVKDQETPKAEPVPTTEVSPKSEPVGNGDETEEVEEVSIADPIEPLNRAMFLFNDKFYFWALKPVARGYNAVVPEPVRISVRNFFWNVKMPIRFVNSLLQGKFLGAGTELARFGINTTLGLAGFLDVAKSKFELDPHDEDFGQTLGFYGLGGLMYIVWPILGPSTVRDTIGFAGDSFLNPVNYITPFEAALGVRAYEQINKTSLDLGTYEDLKEASVEPYIGVRDAFIQYRKKQIGK
jgi:phospholipid-binding lipoprotein MlaA